jgi:DNA-binding XRE family transcriptional regulator
VIALKPRFYLLKSLEIWLGGPAMSNGQDFRTTIRKRRRELDLTQADIARRIGTSAGYITMLEKGGHHPSKNVLIKLADVLRLDRRELFF